MTTAKKTRGRTRDKDKAAKYQAKYRQTSKYKDVLNARRQTPEYKAKAAKHQAKHRLTRGQAQRDKDNARTRAWFAVPENKRRDRERRAENKDRINAQRRARRTSVTNDTHRAYVLRNKYGLTPDDVAKMSAAQGGVCAICSSPPKPGKALSVDHDHSTGRVRELLCNRCNLMVGHLENPHAEAGRAYLAKHKNKS